jgi:NADH-quinone oxidoreductase subunit N
MNFETLISRLMYDTGEVSLRYFTAELALCGTIIALLFVRLFSADRFIPPYWVALLGSLASFGCVYFQFMHLQQQGDVSIELFTGLLIYDKFTVFFRLFLLLFLILVIALTVLSGIPDTEDGPDFYTLLIGSTIGMLLMVSANHLLIVFLGIEMTSVPSYAMVGFLKGRKLSSEASLKYVVYGAGAAGVMLYGISLFAGLLGTASLPLMADRLQEILASGAGMADPTVRTVVLAALMVLVGIAFKLSVVPFHFWCPDAFEGAAAEVGGYLSVASKAAAFGLLIRFCFAMMGQDATGLSEINYSLGIGIGVIAAVTATFGNLAAYTQKNVKRLLAYSTIAHAGYMLMSVGAMLVILNGPEVAGVNRQAEATRAIEGLLYYLIVYLFMNLGAFAIVALVRNEIYSEEIDDYNGLAQQTPFLCVCMAACLFSLIGLPPFGGFFGKLVIFSSLMQAGYVHWSMWAILVIGGLNTVFSLFYYVRIMKAMFIAPRPETARRADEAWTTRWYVLLVTVPVLLAGIKIDVLAPLARGVASSVVGLVSR